MTGYEEKNGNILVYNVRTLHFSRLQVFLILLFTQHSLLKKLKMYITTP